MALSITSITAAATIATTISSAAAIATPITITILVNHLFLLALPLTLFKV